MARSATLNEKRARELFEEGHGCNAIARLLSVDPATISRWAKRESLSFDRSQTAMAVRAHVVDLAETRTLLAKKMAVAASEMLDRLDGSYVVYSFGGKDNTYEEHVLDEAPVEVIRNAVTTAGIAFDKLTKLIEGTEDGDKLAPVESMLGRLAVRFGLAEADAGADA